MKPIANYEIVKGDSPDDLSQKVRLALAEGWEPWGSISVVITGGSAANVWAQPVVLREEENNEGG